MTADSVRKRMIKAFERLTAQMFISSGIVSIDVSPIDIDHIHPVERESIRLALAHPLAKEPDRGINVE